VCDINYVIWGRVKITRYFVILITSISMFTGLLLTTEVIR